MERKCDDQLLESIGYAIKEAREKRGLTQSALAAKVGYSKSMLSQAENAVNSMSLLKLLSIMHVLRLDFYKMTKRKRPRPCRTCKGTGLVR